MHGPIFPGPSPPTPTPPPLVRAHAGTPKDELASLEEVLGKLTVYHTKKQDGGRAFTMPNIPLPSIGITKEQVWGLAWGLPGAALVCGGALLCSGSCT